jgi:hypothetical protein
MRRTPPRLARRFRSSRPLATLEPLENRQLLSAALPGTPFSTFSAVGGSAEFLLDSPTSNLQTRITFSFERDIDSANSSPTDNLNLGVDFFARDTHTLLGHLGSSGVGIPENSYTVTSGGGQFLHVGGNFQVAGSAFGVTFQNATLALDVTFSKTTTVTSMDTLALQVSPDARTITEGHQEAGTAAAAGTFRWTAAAPAVLASIPTPRTVSATQAVYTRDDRQTNTVSDMVNLAPWLDRLTPACQPPKNAQVAVRTVQSATTALVLPGIENAGGINVSQGQRYLQNPGPIDPSAYFAYSLPDGSTIGGLLTSNITLADTSASVTGTGVGEKVPANGSIPNVPFSMDLHWQAVPGDVTQTFIRTITTTPDTVTTQYTTSLERGAAVTGYLSLAALPPVPTVAVDGLLTTSTDVTLVVPASKAPSNWSPTPVSKAQWQSVVNDPWTAAIKAGTDEGLLSTGKPSKTVHIAIVNVIVKALPTVRAWLMVKVGLTPM